MIRFESSEEAIKGLAKMIVQDPLLPIWLRKTQIKSIDNKAMKSEEFGYIGEQNKILNKAENLANSGTGYIFDINYYREYIVYKKIYDELVPINEEFKNKNYKTIGYDDLIKHLQKSQIKNIITFEDAQTEDYFYTYPEVRQMELFEDRHEYEKDFIHYRACHNPVKFNVAEIKFLKENGIMFQTLNEEDKIIFTSNLKKITSTDDLKPAED